MYFSNLCGSKAVCHSVQQLKIVKIAVIFLLTVQIIEASSSFGFNQFNWSKSTTSTTKSSINKFSTTTKAAKTIITLTAKSTGAENYCSMCKSHVACKKNDVRSKISTFSKFNFFYLFSFKEIT